MSLKAIFAIWFVGSMAVSFVFAAAGHPGSVWLWRDVLGLLP